MLYISASSLGDFYKCPKSYYYRVNNKESAILSDDMIFGSVIHEAVELHDDPESCCEFAIAEWQKRSGDSYSKTRKPPKSIKNILKGYFKIIDEIKGTTDHMEMIREHFFRFQYRDDIMLVGKIDLIADGKIYDWKTGSAPPSNYNLYDLQFTTYWLAYREMYKVDPESINYGWLYGGRTYKVPMKEALLKNLDLAIDRMSEICYNMDNNVRILGYQCNRCLYRGICHLELEE
jgi:CRISPR/Cas system-associated exonuclease Cas4 (RecB family)